MSKYSEACLIAKKAKDEYDRTQDDKVSWSEAMRYGWTIVNVITSENNIRDIEEIRNSNEEFLKPICTLFENILRNTLDSELYLVH